jgi:ribokinase
LLVINLEVPLDALTIAAQTAKSRGARVVLNPAPAQKLPPELLASADVIAPNEGEAAALTGIEVSDEMHARQAAQALHMWTHGDVVITLGERGALAFPAGSASPGAQMVAPHPVRAVDTTAAGDAFVGGLAVGLGEGKSLLEAARLGNAAGALAVTRPGAQPSLPTRKEVTELLKSFASSGS